MVALFQNAFLFPQMQNDFAIIRYPRVKQLIVKYRLYHDLKIAAKCGSVTYIFGRRFLYQQWAQSVILKFNEMTFSLSSIPMIHSIGKCPWKFSSLFVDYFQRFKTDLKSTIDFDISTFLAAQFWIQNIFFRRVQSLLRN